MRQKGYSLLARRRGALVVTLLYGALAGLYIWLSDTLVLALSGGDPVTQHRWQVLKGWGYVAVTSVALYGLLRLVSRASQQREQVQREAEELAEQFRTLVELSPDAIVIHQDGVVKFANPQAARMWGAREPQELVGKLALELVAPSYREIVRERVLRGLEEGRPAPPLVEEFLKLDGTVFRGEAVAAPVTFQGRPAMEVVIRDVTEREQAEAALREAQKMEAVGALAAGVAHDFNNLLQAAEALLYSLWQKLGESPELSGEFRSLEQFVQRGAGVVRQLLLFSRRDIPQPQRLDLRTFVEETTGWLARFLPECVTLKVQVAPGPMVVEADPGQIQQVILNLVLNARDAMPQGGTLTVSVSGNAEEVVLAVADTGVGIPEEIRSQIFDPLFTTKGPGRGTGLGLAVVRMVVARLGGRVEVDTEVGKGSTFTVFLPRASGGPPEPSGAVAAGTGQPPAGGRLLLVEDDSLTRESLAQVLTSLGYQVTAVASGEEVKGLLAAQSFDVLLTDFLLPGTTGVQLAEELRQHWPALAVVIMSGYAQDQVFRKQVGSGQLRFLAKPFTVEQLRRELTEATANKG